MSTKEQALQAIADSPFIMLASADGDQPCIRMIDHLVYGDKVVFIANGKSAKIAQFEANNKVAFATEPSPNVQLEVRCNQAVVTPSTEDLEELKEKLVQKRESAVHMLRGFGENAVAFDITFPSLLASERGREEVIEL